MPSQINNNKKSNISPTLVLVAVVVVAVAALYIFDVTGGEGQQPLQSVQTVQEQTQQSGRGPQSFSGAFVSVTPEGYNLDNNGESLIVPASMFRAPFVVYKHSENGTSVIGSLGDIVNRSKLTILTDTLNGKRTVIAIIIDGVQPPAAPKETALPDTGS